jgi:3-methyladenine DNA glycosylase AlkD
VPPVIEEHLVRAVRHALARAGDPERAAAMRAYMKSALPYRGVPSPDQRCIWRTVFPQFPIADPESWQATILVLWRGAAYREERYAAMALAGERRYDAWQTLEAIPMYEELIVTGAWWDYVDTIAAHRIGHLLETHPAAMRPLLRRWSRDEHLWKRRTAILAQLTFKERTDTRLLFACIDANLADTAFFIRKAIGWALRQYARTDPEAVSAYVRRHASRLSGLSRREATKHLAM